MVVAAAKKLDCPLGEGGDFSPARMLGAADRGRWGALEGVVDERQRGQALERAALGLGDLEHGAAERARLGFLTYPGGGGEAEGAAQRVDRRARGDLGGAGQ